MIRELTDEEMEILISKNQTLSIKLKSLEDVVNKEK